MYVKGQDEIFFVRTGKKWNVTYYKGYCGATLLIGTSWVTFFSLGVICQTTFDKLPD
jgi:hypothetical protein